MRRSLAVAALAVLPLAAEAGALTVNPIRLELAAGQAATSMTIGNAADAPATVQVSVQRWQHRDGADELEPATGGDAPIVTPPMFQLAPGASQIVRIGFAGRHATAEEGRWRLVVEELPPAHAQAQAQALPVALTPLQIATRLRVSLPLFRLPAVVRSQLDWQLERASSGSIPALAVVNRGTTTERIDRAQLHGGDAALAGIARPVYLFPGEQRRFPLPASAIAATAPQLSVAGSVPLDDHALAWPAE
jgi:fimbrial chaperone protein